MLHAPIDSDVAIDIRYIRSMDGAELLVDFLPKSLDFVVDGSQLALLSYLHAGQLSALPFVLFTQNFADTVAKFLSLIQFAASLSKDCVFVRNVGERVGILCVSFGYLKPFSAEVGCLYLSVRQVI